MSDLSITATSVVAGAGARSESGTAGATVTAGQTVYLDGTTDTYKLADCDSATAAVRSVVGIALNPAASGQPLKVHTRGPITIGATMTVGTTYYLSQNPGGICPIGDLSTGDYRTIIGIATSATVLDVLIHASGVAP